MGAERGIEFSEVFAAIANHDEALTLFGRRSERRLVRLVDRADVSFSSIDGIERWIERIALLRVHGVTPA